jgi:prolyl-tRNA synthetase
MRYSQALIPTVKEVPAEAEIPSHQLMIRAGLMRKLASGTYIYLPAGWRTLQKIMAIVREEMNKAGAQEILMPAVQPIELWQKTGRDVDYGETMAKFTDRHGRENVLAPTAEEVITFLAAGEINSYKQLPVNLYQISFKFRDEFRPRFGVLRSREFIMKDAYSFHANPDGLEVTYRKMYEAYKRIFARCGLKYQIVEAESGEMGGSGSHQFTIPCESGEDVIVYTEDGSYAANIEKAVVDAATKVKSTDTIGPMEEVHTPNVGSIEAVCEFLGTKPEDMIKTLIYSTSEKNAVKQIRAEEAKHDGREVITSEGYFINRYVVLVRGDHEVNAEKLRIVTGESLELAQESDIVAFTGAAVGFAGPVGLAEKACQIVIDHSVAAMAVGITGANQSHYHTKNVVPGRDFPLEGSNVKVADIRNAVEGDTHEGKKLLFKRGIEVGQVFKLGTKYSIKLGAKFKDEGQQEHPCLMGCYGIGINRIMASAIETRFDKDGIVWPISIAPFEVIVTPVNQEDEQVGGAAEAIYKELFAAGIEVLIDDRDVRGGVKFKDADLLGIPVRVTIGKKSIAEGNVEIKLRSESENKKVPFAGAAKEVIGIVNSLKAILNVAD